MVVCTHRCARALDCGFSAARVQVKVHALSLPKSEVLKAATDITKVLEDGKNDDASVKNIIAGSKTHGGISPSPPLSLLARSCLPDLPWCPRTSHFSRT